MGEFDEGYKGLGKETLRRVNHAINLFRQGLVENIFCVGGARPKRNVFGSEYMKQTLIDSGVPSKKILTERQSYDSKSNWKIASCSIKANDWNAVVIITSPLHIHRLKRSVFNEPADHLDLFFSPYSYHSYKDTNLELTRFAAWLQVQHEWLGYLSHYLLPESLRRYVLKTIRQ